MERVLVAQAPIASALVRLFETQFALDAKAREARPSGSGQSILRALDKVASPGRRPHSCRKLPARDPRDAAH
jgi:hypothetical protein